MLVSRNLVEPLGPDPHDYCVEASDLGIEPGVFPASLPTDLGNGQPLLRHRGLQSGLGVVYVQQFGCVTVTVWND